jgi:membrane protease YdiL (CAAX protease family)
MNERRQLSAPTSNWLLLVTLGTYLLGGGIFASLVENYALKILIVQLFVVLPTIVWICLSQKGDRKRVLTEEFRFRKISLSTALLVMVTMLFLSPLLTFVNLLSQMFSNYVAGEEIVGQISDQPFWVAILVIALLPAVCEELVYRGMLYGGYRRRSVWMGALLSGLVFGMMHGNLNQMMYALLMGFVFALVDEITESVVSSMIMHFLVNGTSVALVYLMNYAKNSGGEIAEMLAKSEEQAESLGWADLLPYGILGLIGGFVAYRLICVLAIRCGTAGKLKAELKERGKLLAFGNLITAPLILALCILAVLVVVTEVYM